MILKGPLMIDKIRSLIYPIYIVLLRNDIPNVSFLHKLKPLYGYCYHFDEIKKIWKYLRLRFDVSLLILVSF